MILIIGGIVALSSSISNIDAVPKDPRFGGSCDTKTTKAGDSIQTCCWREKVPGQYLAKTYCQTCTNGKNCGDKVLQMQQLETSESSRPLINDGVAKHPLTQEPTSKSDNGIFVEEGITEQELQHAPSSDGQKEAEPSSRESLSNSDNLDKTFTQQDNEDSSGSQESSDFDQSGDNGNDSDAGVLQGEQQ